MLAFYYVAKSKIDDVFTEHGGLLHVLPLTVHLNFFLRTSRGDHCETFLLFEYCFGTPPSWLKVIGWWPTAFYCQPQPQVFGSGLKGLGLRLWAQGLTNLAYHKDGEINLIQHSAGSPSHKGRKCCNYFLV